MGIQYYSMYKYANSLYNYAMYKYAKNSSGRCRAFCPTATSIPSRREFTKNLHTFYKLNFD